jgi:Gp37 protein
VIRATTIAAAESGLLARLTAKIESYSIESFPDNPKGYRLTNQRGAVLIAYRGAVYDDTIDTEAIAQARAMEFDLNVVTKQLRGNDSAYVLIELVRAAISGFKLPGFSPCRLRRERFLARDEGQWIYCLTIGLGTMAIQVDDDELLPLLARITAESDYSTTEVPSA